jgi:hypothetical protein
VAHPDPGVRPACRRVRVMTDLQPWQRCRWCHEIVTLHRPTGLLATSRDVSLGYCWSNPLTGNHSYVRRHMLAPALRWHDNGNEGADDQNADSYLAEHAFWEIGHAHGSSTWNVELVVKDDDLQDQAYLCRRECFTEEEAKLWAAEIEAGPRVEARFVPQAWVNNAALDIDPQGPQTWDASALWGRLNKHYRWQLMEEFDGDEVLDTDDCFAQDPAAPRWVREHQGPFSIYLTMKGATS